MKRVYAEEEIHKIVRDQSVRLLRLCSTDVNDTLKNVEVPLSQLDRVLANETRFDGSGIDGYVQIGENDMVLYPNSSTWAVLPWGDNEGGKIGRSICSVRNTDGTPFADDPRNNLKRVVAEMKDMGYNNFEIGFEAKFFLFKENGESSWTIKPTDQSLYFDMASENKDAKCRRDIIETLEKIGFEVEAARHEVGAGQQEINFRFNDVVATADKVLTFKVVVRQITKKHGLHAIFVSRPIKDSPGSGMHINMSLFKDGRNVFYDKDGEYRSSKTALYFLNGILSHTRALTYVDNPIVNPYKHLIPGLEAPVYISWANKNRSPPVRILDAEGTDTRLEMRSADPAVNPYLLLAVRLKAGLKGIKEAKMPMAPITSNVFEMSAEEKKERGIIALPSTLHNATKYFKQSKLVQDALGEHLTQGFIESRELEWAQYIQSISDWERNRYMNY